MQNEANEVVWNLKDLKINVIIKWRYIVIFSCIIASIIGLQHVVAYKTVDELKYNEEKLNYENDYNTYLTTIDMNKKIIEYKLLDMNSQQEYNENSIKMKLDPLNVPVGVLKLYIKSDYMIMPELTYQNIDLSERVVSAYYEYITDGSFYQKLQEEMSEEIPLDYLKENVEITQDIDKRVISIKVNYTTEALCQEVIEDIWNLLQEKREEIVVSIGTHDIYKYDEAIYTDLDYMLKDFQQSKIQRVKDLNDELIVLYKEQTNLKSQGAPVFIYDTSYQIKSGIMKVVIGFIIVCILCCIYYGVMGLISGKLSSVSDFKDRFGIDVIGTISKKRKSKLDCWMLQKLGRIKSDLSEEDNVTLIWEIVKKLINTNHETFEEKTAEKQSVLIIGSSTAGSYNEYCKKIQALSTGADITFVDGMSLMKNTETIKTISQYQYVLLLEQFDVSEYAEIEEEINLLKRFHMAVLGAVIVNV